MQDTLTGDRRTPLSRTPLSLRLAAAIHAAGKLTETHRKAIFGDTWPLANSTRNRIVHGYAHVDRLIIEQTVRQDLPAIEAAMAQLSARLTEDGPTDSP